MRFFISKISLALLVAFSLVTFASCSRVPAENNPSVDYESTLSEILV